MRNRLLALAAAVAMVVVAVQVRARIDGNEASRPRLVCAVELAEVCDRLRTRADTRIEPAHDTAARLAAGDRTDVDGWLTPTPWPQLLDAARRRQGNDALLEVGEPLGRQRVGVALWPERLAVLRKACGRDVDWACLVHAASASSWEALGGDPSWGVFKLGFPNPTRDAGGLLALGSLAAALAPDWPTDDEEFPGTVATLARAVPRPLPPLATVLAAGPSLADAYVVGFPRPATSRMTLVYPAPVVTAEVVLARSAGDDGDRLFSWTRELRFGGVDPLGTPMDPGTLEALRALWDEVAP